MPDMPDQWSFADEYHGHQTLPPEIATKLKKEHKKKYGTQTNKV